MASINGIQIKSMKSFRDHDGIDVYQGNVYYGNRKLGFWSQDSCGGPDMFRFDAGVLDDEVEKYRSSDMVRDEYRDLVNLEILLDDLVGLALMERSYKRGVKKGYGTLVVARDGCIVIECMCVGGKDDFLKSESYDELKRDCSKKLSDGWDGEFELYDSLDDFKIEV